MDRKDFKDALTCDQVFFFSFSAYREGGYANRLKKHPKVLPRLVH